MPHDYQRTIPFPCTNAVCNASEVQTGSHTVDSIHQESLERCKGKLVSPNIDRDHMFHAARQTIFHSCDPKLGTAGSGQATEEEIRCKMLVRRSGAMRSSVAGA